MEQVEYQTMPPVERISSPHVEAALKSFRSSDHYTPERFSTMEGVLNDLWNLQVEGTHLFTTANGRISTPYARIEITEYAKSLFNKDFSQLPSDDLGPLNKLFIIFPSLQSPDHGHITMFMEQAFHRSIVGLMTILDSINDPKRPTRPQNFSIITLGAPTVRWGEIDQQFVSDLETDGLRAWARVYSELIEQNIPIDPAEKARTQLTLNGISMGATFAAQTAEDLVSKHLVTQRDRKPDQPTVDNHLPNMVVLLEAPTGQHLGGRKTIRIKGGFGLGAAFSLLLDPYQRRVSLTERGLTKDLIPVFAKKGILENMSPEQIRLKKEAIAIVIDELMKGVPLNTELVRFHTMRGKHDWTLTDKKELRGGDEESLGRNLLKSTNQNLQEFQINSTHARKFFYEGEFQRWARFSDMLSKQPTEG